MSACSASYVQPSSCVSHFQSSYNSYSSGGNCNTPASSHAASACQNVMQSYQNHSYCNYNHTHTSCGSSSGSVNVLTVALQDAANMGAGVQGTVGCTLDANGDVTMPNLGTLPVGDDTDGTAIVLGDVSSTTSVVGNGIGDQVIVNSGSSNILVAGNGDGDFLSLGFNDGVNDIGGDGNILVAGNGAGDFLMMLAGDSNQLWAGNGDGDFLLVDSGNSNILHVGNGSGDQLIVGTGNNNDLHAGNGAGDFLLVGSGDNNCLTVGTGDGGHLEVGTGTSNDLEAGNGNGNQLIVDTGDNNLLNAGNGANDFLNVGSGVHNSLIVGNGANAFLEVGTGDYNFLHAGNGAGDSLLVSSGNYNALIVGDGAADVVTVGTGDHNVLAVGNGAGDLIQFSSGNFNIILEGNGINDQILVGTGNNNAIVMGNGDGDTAWGSLGDGNAYMTGAGNDLVHTGGGADFVYVDNHTEQSAAAMADPFHLTTQDSLAQNLFADGGNDTFAIQGTKLNSCQTYSSYHCGNSYSTAVTWQSALKQVGGDAPGLGTTVMTGGGGAEKYWFSDLWGNAVITDFVAARDKIMIGGVSDPNISNLGAVKFQYVHSAYDTTNTGNVDLLITFGSSSNLSQSITLIDFKDTNASIASSFNNLTVTNPTASETLLSKIFDFSLADNQAVTNEIASLNAQHLILH